MYSYIQNIKKQVPHTGNNARLVQWSIIWLHCIALKFTEDVYSWLAEKTLNFMYLYLLQICLVCLSVCLSVCVSLTKSLWNKKLTWVICIWVKIKKKRIWDNSKTYFLNIAVSTFGYPSPEVCASWTPSHLVSYYQLFEKGLCKIL